MDSQGSTPFYSGVGIHEVGEEVVDLVVDDADLMLVIACGQDAHTATGSLEFLGISVRAPSGGRPNELET